MNRFAYRPPKSSVWGHTLHHMKPGRQRALVRQFLATATAAHGFSEGSLSIAHAIARAPVDEAVRHFESLLGQSSYDGFFPKLAARDVDRCLDEFEADERWYVEFGASVLQAISISQWLIDGVARNTLSALHVHYGSMPVLGTTLGFESIEDFRSVKSTLESIKLCKLNEKHLKQRRHA
jgi:hypothetical protein